MESTMRHCLLLLWSLIAISSAQSIGSGTGSGTGSGILIPGCMPGQFRCLNNTCIDDSLACNGEFDCPSGEDELVCDDMGFGDCRPDQISCSGEQACVSLSRRCDGVAHCREATDESNCPPPPLGSTCNATQFECSANECVPLAERCNGIVSCSGSQDELQCDPPRIITPPPSAVAVQASEDVILECTAEGDPPPFVTWLKNSAPLPREPRYSVSSEDGIGTLTIRDASLVDQGEYTCVIESVLFGKQMASQRATLSVNDTTPSTCEDHVGTTYIEGQNFYNVQVFGSARLAAVDVIFVVDESGSMVMEHQWLSTEVVRLDQQLRLRGIGVGDRPNQFALVGFGRPNPVDIIGIVISQLTSSENLVTAAQQLMLTGIAEDGYAAIDHALDNIVLRNGTSRQLIFISDESRDTIRTDLTRETVAARLRAEGFVLNSVLNQGFLVGSSDALGLDGNGTAFVINTSNPDLYMTQPGGVPNLDPFSSFTGTYEDYVVLTHQLGGVAWDLNQLRLQGQFSEAFTNAFTEVKVMEVMAELSQCFDCLCTEPPLRCNPVVGVALQDCIGLVPENRCVIDSVTSLFPGENRIVIGPPVNVTRAADIILIVDESGSMTMEHQWIPNMIQRLDAALMDVNIGVQPVNRFGLVGFGDDCVDNITAGRIVMNSAQELFAVSSGFSEFATMLNTSGQREDGYGGIKVALDGYSLRDVARQFILITDEDRDVVRSNITREIVQQKLETAGVLLNTAVTEEYTGGMLRALGINSNGAAFVFDPSAANRFRGVAGSGKAVPDSGHGSTNVDYTQLALELGGASWDLSLLRRGGVVAEAFTNAFVYVKVLEIRRQMETCLNCSCPSSGGQAACSELPNSNFPECMRIPVPLPGEIPITISLNTTSDVLRVLPGQQATITCISSAASSSVAWTFNGGALPSNTEGPAGQGNSTLVIEVASEENSGLYICLANSLSEFYKATAYVYVEFYDPDQDLNISLTPLELRAATGQNVSLTCSVPEPAEFSWLFDDGPLPGNARAAIDMTRSVLTILSAADTNVGGYTCLVNNSVRGLVNDDTAYLDVRDSPPVLIVEPQITNVMEGDLAMLTCYVTCPCPGAMPVWSRDDGFPLPDTAVIVDSSDNENISTTLVITKVTCEDGVRYRCSAILDGAIVQALGAINVTATGVIEFKVDLNMDGVIRVTPNDTLVVICESTRRASSIVWRFEGETLQQLPSGNSTGDDIIPGESSLDNAFSVNVSPTRAVLSITGATMANVGVYECTAEADSGETDSANVTVMFAAPTQPSTQSPQPTRISSVSLSSESSRLTRVSSVSLISESPRLTRVSSVPLSSPPVSSSSPSVSVLPTPTSLPDFLVVISASDDNPALGESIVIFCDATHPVDSFMWTFNFNPIMDAFTNHVIRRVGTMRSVLTIDSIMPANDGGYQCRANSSITGESMNTFVQIDIEEVLSVTITPDINITANLTNMIEISCVLDCSCVGTLLNWTRDGGDLPSSAVISYSETRRTVYLRISSVQDDAIGTYICTATNAILGTVMERIDLIVLDTDGSPIVPTEPPRMLNTMYTVSITPDSVKLPPGACFSFICKSTAAATGFVWMYDFKPLPEGVVVKNLTVSTSSIFIQNVSKEFIGTYFCVALYADNTYATSFAMLDFDDPLATVISTTNVVPAPQGSRFQVSCRLNCTCTGTELEWRRREADRSLGSLPPSAEVDVSPTRRTMTLSFNSIATSDAGTYVCVASRQDSIPVEQDFPIEVV